MIALSVAHDIGSEPREYSFWWGRQAGTIISRRQPSDLVAARQRAQMRDQPILADIE